MKSFARICFVLAFSVAQVGANAQSISALFSAKQYDRVGAFLAQIDSLQPDEQAMVAYALLRSEQFFTAESAFAAAEKSGYGNARFYHQYAQMYMARNEFPAALNKLNKGLQLKPEEERLLYDKTAALMAIEDWSEASMILRKLLRKHPNNAKYTALLGTCYLEKEEPLRALRMYEEYLPFLGNTDFDRDILWDCARIARYRLGDLPKAEEYLIKLTKAFPNFWLGQQELVQLYNMRKKFFSAEAILSQATYAYEKGELPREWMRSGYWMTDVIMLNNHRIHVYASLFNDDEHPAFKLFILDTNQQHIRGKIDVWQEGEHAYALKLETTLKSEGHSCTDVDDYAHLRSCIKTYVDVLD